MANIYEEWLSCSEKWRNSTWAATLSKSQKLTKIGARRWMTRQQIYERYQDWEIVHEITELKMQEDDKNMAHPDAPHVDVRGPDTSEHDLLKTNALSIDISELLTDTVRPFASSWSGTILPKSGRIALCSQVRCHTRIATRDQARLVSPRSARSRRTRRRSRAHRKAVPHPRTDGFSVTSNGRGQQRKEIEERQETCFEREGEI